MWPYPPRPTTRVFWDGGVQSANPGMRKVSRSHLIIALYWYLVFDRSMIFLFMLITIFDKNGIVADNIAQNAEYRLFWPVLYRPISGKTGILADNIGRHRISVQHYSYPTYSARQSMLSMTLYLRRGSRAMPSWTFLSRRGVYGLITHLSLWGPIQ